MGIEIMESEDGTLTLYNNSLGEGYHSKHGALAETHHIFIENGLKKVLPLGYNPLNILEVGYGTALNCLATAHHLSQIKESSDLRYRVNYFAIESTPIDEKVLLSLNHTQLFTPKFKPSAQKIYSAPWNSESLIEREFRLTPLEGDILALPKEIERTLLEREFHLIYFDPFSPKVSPQLWSVQLFRFIFNRMAERALLVTYSSKGEVRRAMERVGLKVERVAGPKGKREITVATKGSFNL